MKFAAAWTVLLVTLAVGGAHAGVLSAENALKDPGATVAGGAAGGVTDSPAAVAGEAAAADTAAPTEDKQDSAGSAKTPEAEKKEAEKKEADKEICKPEAGTAAATDEKAAAGAASGDTATSGAVVDQGSTGGAADAGDSAATDKAATPTCSKVDYASKDPKGTEKAAESRPEVASPENLTKPEDSQTAATDTRNYNNFGGQTTDDTKGDGTVTADSLAKQNSQVPVTTPQDTTAYTPQVTQNALTDQTQLTQTPQTVPYNNTNGTATAKLQAGQWPTNVQDRVTLAVAYMREKGYPEPVIQDVVMTIQRESGWNYLAKANTSSASGLGQYIDATWATSAARCGVDASRRWDPQAQLDVIACDKNALYTKYASGNLNCGSTNISFSACSYVYHYAGSWDTKRPDRIQYALNYFNKTYQTGANQYAQAASTLGGGDMNSILAGMNTSQVTGLGSQVSNQYSTPRDYQTNMATQFPGVYTNPSSLPNPQNSAYNPYTGQYTGTPSSANGYSGASSSSTSSSSGKEADKEERKALKKEMREWAKLCDVDAPKTKSKDLKVLEAKLTLMIKRCKV